MIIVIMILMMMIVMIVQYSCDWSQRLFLSIIEDDHNHVFHDDYGDHGHDCDDVSDHISSFFYIDIRDHDIDIHDDDCNDDFSYNDCDYYPMQ